MGKRKARVLDHVQGQCDVWLTAPTKKQNSQKKQRILSIHPVNIIGSGPVTFDTSSSSSTSKTKQSKLMTFFKPKSAKVPQQRSENWNENAQTQANKKTTNQRSISDYQPCTSAICSTEESSFTNSPSYMDSLLTRSNSFQYTKRSSGNTEMASKSPYDLNPYATMASSSSQSIPSDLTGTQDNTSLNFDTENDSSSLEDIHLSNPYSGNTQVSAPKSSSKLNTYVPVSLAQSLSSGQTISRDNTLLNFDSKIDSSSREDTSDQAFGFDSQFSAPVFQDKDLDSEVQVTSSPDARLTSDDLHCSPASEEGSFLQAAAVQSLGKSDNKTEHGSTKSKSSLANLDTFVRSSKFDDHSPVDCSQLPVKIPELQSQNSNLPCPLSKILALDSQQGSQTRWKQNSKRKRFILDSDDENIPTTKSQSDVKQSQTTYKYERIYHKGDRFKVKTEEEGKVLSPIPLDMVIMSNSFSQHEDSDLLTDSKFHDTLEITGMSTSASEGHSNIFDTDLKMHQIKFSPSMASTQKSPPLPSTSTCGNSFTPRCEERFYDRHEILTDGCCVPMAVCRSQLSLDTEIVSKSTNKKIQQPIGIHELVDTQDVNLLTMTGDSDDECSQDIDSVLSPQLTQDSVGAYRLK